MTGSAGRDERRAQYDATDSVEWEDPDENNGEWPYPTRYVRREITGALADDVRRRLSVAADVPVLITEEEISGGYSEFTQETDYCMTIECGGTTKVFDARSAEGNFAALLKWIDERPERVS